MFVWLKSFSYNLFIFGILFLPLEHKTNKQFLFDMNGKKHTRNTKLKQIYTAVQRNPVASLLTGKNVLYIVFL